MMKTVIPQLEKTLHTNKLFAMATTALTTESVKQFSSKAPVSEQRANELRLLLSGTYEQVHPLVLQRITTIYARVAERAQFVKVAQPTKRLTTAQGLEDDDAGPGRKGVTHATALSNMKDMMARLHGDEDAPVLSEILRATLGNEDPTVDEDLRRAVRVMATKKDPVTKHWVRVYLKIPAGTVPEEAKGILGLLSAGQFTREVAARYCQAFLFKMTGVLHSLDMFVNITSNSEESELSHSLMMGMAMLVKSKDTLAKNLCLGSLNATPSKEPRLTPVASVDTAATPQGKAARSLEEIALWKAQAKCHFCQKAGHFQPECPDKAAGKPKTKKSGKPKKGGENKLRKTDDGGAVTP